MKKILLVMLAVVLATGLFLAGCSSPAPAPKPSPAPVPAPTSVAPAPKPAPAPAPVPKPAPAAPAKTWTLKFNYMNPPEAPYTKWGHVPWGNDIEKATNGRVKIQHFMADTLMKSVNAPEGVKSGIADVAWLFTGYFPGQFEPFDSITLPFIAPSGEVASRVIWKLFNDFPEIQAATKDYKVLTAWTSAPYMLLTSKKQVKTPEDIKGLKIRSTGGPPTEMSKLLGATPLLQPMDAVYLNMQKGVIDGAWIPSEANLGFRLYEVGKYYNWITTVTVVFALIMNKEVWNEMPKDIQDAIMSVSGEAQSIRYGGGVFDRSDVEVRDTVKKAGSEMIEYTPKPEEIDKWRAIAGKPLWDSWVKGVEAKKIPGQKLLDETLKLVKEYSAQPSKVTK